VGGEEVCVPSRKRVALPVEEVRQALVLEEEVDEPLDETALD
jgi:hypothetical protein